MQVILGENHNRMDKIIDQQLPGNLVGMTYLPDTLQNF